MPTPKKEAFLAAYAVTCSISGAAKAARINRGTHYDWLQADPEYKAKFERAQEDAVQALEDEAIRRAYHGIEKPLTVAGKRELIREYSDTLLIFLLKGLRPAKYGERYDVAVSRVERRGNGKLYPSPARSDSQPVGLRLDQCVG
jgi:hypothetical protein